MSISSALRSDKSTTSFFTDRLALAIAYAVAVAVLLHPAPTSALVKFDFEQHYFDERPTGVLDHYVVEQDGVYHLFYLRGNPAIDIGHATTTDFTHWNIEEPVLETGTWDQRLWAPCLIQMPTYGWNMYFTGVNSFGAQQSGVAMTQDLFEWHKLSWPVYNPDPSWAQWADSLWCHGRDPHVIRHDGKYYMFVTAKTWSGYGAVACAESNDGFAWTDIGPIYLHDSWHVFESVFILEKNGKFHMFFTEEAVYGTSHMSSNDLFSGWDIANRRIIDSGHAPQITTLPNGTEIFSRHSRYDNGVDEAFHTLRFDTLAWVGDIPAPYKPWPLAGDWNLIWGNAFPYQPVYRNNPKARGVDLPNTFEGNCWIGTYEQYTGPMGFGMPGGFQGDSRTGVLRSDTFTIAGNSMNLLVGGGDNLDLEYVALVDAVNGEVLFKETGQNNQAMDRRYWNLKPHVGREAYIEIADLSTDAWGFINCDDITESWDVIDENDGDGGNDRKTVGTVIQNADDRGTVEVAGPVLFQNSPNPFNPITSIAYQIPDRGHVTLRIYDVHGKLVRELIDDTRAPGSHTVNWNGQDQAGRRAVSGVYLYRLTFEGSVIETRKMLMLK
jgi:hypothetical protein